MAYTIAQRLTDAIARQQAEVDRLTAVVTTDLPAAQKRLSQLMQAAAAVTPGMETMHLLLESLPR